MATPAVTVIVPFYNASGTIEKALASIVAQNQRDIQIVMVNDGSNDNSVEVIDRFIAQNGPFIYPPLLINVKTNMGVANARALGLRHAEGDYIIHCDVDDYLHPYYISQLYDTLKISRADIVVSPFTEISGKSMRVIPTSFTDTSTLNTLPIDTVTFSLCNKLISRRFIEENNISFFSGVDRWEDLGFISQALALRPRIAVCPMAGYYYVKAPKGKSLSGSGSALLLHDHLRMALYIEEWMVERGLTNSYKPFLDYLKFVAKIKYLRCPVRDVKKWKETFPEVNDRIMNIRQLPLWIRMITRSVAILPTALSQTFANIADRMQR